MINFKLMRIWSDTPRLASMQEGEKFYMEREWNDSRCENVEEAEWRLSKSKLTM